jgi:hypothetical protein
MYPVKSDNGKAMRHHYPYTREPAMKLLETAKLLAPVLLKACGIKKNVKTKKRIFLVFTGTSGVMASLMMEMALNMINPELKIIKLHIAKKGEPSHRANCEGECYLIDCLKPAEYRTVFVDDFIISGTSLRNIKKAVSFPINIVCIMGVLCGSSNSDLYNGVDAVIGFDSTYTPPKKKRGKA